MLAYVRYIHSGVACPSGYKPRVLNMKVAECADCCPVRDSEQAGMSRSIGQRSYFTRGPKITSCAISGTSAFMPAAQLLAKRGDLTLRDRICEIVRHKNDLRTTQSVSWNWRLKNQTCLALSALFLSVGVDVGYAAEQSEATSVIFEVTPTKLRLSNDTTAPLGFIQLAKIQPAKNHELVVSKDVQLDFALKLASDNQLVTPGMGSNSSSDKTDQKATYTILNVGPRLGFAQAEDGQGHYQIAQAEPAPALNDNSTVQPGNLPDRPLDMGSVGPVTNEIDLALGQRQVYSDLRSLQDRIAIMQRPIANVISRYSTQSDNLDIYQEEISQDIFFDQGASRFRPGLQYLSYTPGVGAGVSQYAAGFDGSYRINDLSAVTGDLWLNSIEPKNFQQYVTPTYDVYLTLWPSDFVRIDFDNKRETFDNVTSLQMGITAESIGGSVDYTPYDYLRLTVRGGGSFYSDTNDRQSEEAEAVLRVMNLPTVEVGLRASGFQFSQQLNHGYFNPGNYASGEAMFRLQTDLTNELNVELAASGGIEDANPGGTKPLVKSLTTNGVQTIRKLDLDGGAAYFSSQDSNSSGFARTSVTLGLHYRFE